MCIRDRVGCALECKFCSTAQQGFNRNLRVSEIIGQVWRAAKIVGAVKTTGVRPITNVVMMGMGEPLLNLNNVVPAMEILSLIHICTKAGWQKLMQGGKDSRIGRHHVIEEKSRHAQCDNAVEERPFRQGVKQQARVMNVNGANHLTGSVLKQLLPITGRH